MKLKDLKESLEGVYVSSQDKEFWIEKISNKLKEGLIKEYHRSDGNKHKFIREFLNLTEKELSVLGGKKQ